MTDLQDVDRQFLEACERGNLDEVLKILYYHDNGPTKLLERDPESLNHMHYFHATCFHGHHEVVEQLFVFGVDVNLKSHHGTPLSVASQAGHLETVKVLVEHNATIFDPDMPETLSPIFQASKNGHIDVFNYLISKKPEIIPVMGPRLLVQACHDGFLTIVIELLSKDVDVNGISASSSPSHAPISIDSLLESPLHAACSQNHTEVAAYLLQEGAEVTVDLVEHYHEELGEAVSRNFKKYTGRHWKEQGNLVEADFRAANYYSIHESWFTRFSDRLVSVDLSNNHIQNIPKDVMNLPSLREIDVSSNDLFDLPEVVDIVNSRLVTITATSNQLPCIPWSFFHIQSLQHLNLSNNKIRSLLNVQECHGYGVEEDTSEELVWTCSHLKSLNLSKNELTFIPLAIHGANSLEKLLLSNNKLATIPRGWKCPLRILHLARNDLEDFQESVFNTWIQTMEDLNLSSNKLTEISWDICQLQTLKYLDLSHNKIESLPPKSYWTCSNLRSLNLSNNKLCGVRQCLEGSGSTKPKRFSLARSPASEEHQLVEDEFPHEVFGGSLELLDLSNNELYAIPGSLCKLTSLEELNFTGNRNLRTLPPELGNLMECFQLRLEGLNLTGIPKYARPGRNVTSKDILAYLRAKQRKAVPYYRMKLMVVGLQGRGKTTLLASLRNKPLPPNISTVGIVVNEWTISGCQSFLEKMTKRGRKETPPKSNPTITFSTWDLAGQQVYYSTHQCFLSTNTLYLAVWNTTHGVEGIEKLKPWLLNVQARAPGSHIIIVGTHVDLLPEKTKAKRVDELRLKIGKKYNKKGYPIIKGNYVVSCTTGENIAVLRQAIYAAALELKELENAGRGESLIGRKIPLSYIKLQENVIKEAETRKREDKPPILNEEQMLELAKQDPNNDIFARDELVLAARFLHENGVILHFNDRSRGLDKLFFIEPGWLCEIMAVLVTVKETNAFVKGGIIERSNVDLLLRNPRLPSKFLEQYIQLMERFEVALTLNEHHLLVPSMLPRDKPGLRLHDLRKTLTKKNNRRSRSSNDDLSNEGTTDSESEYLKRLYKMNYVPSGFWSRLIARLMIAIQKWGVAEGLGDELISSEAGKTVRKTSNLRPVPHGYSMIYWREGMGVVYDGGHLMVESFRDKERNVYNGLFEDVEGVMVTVWSAEKDFSALGFVTDQINALISEWYPGLEEHDKHGIPLVRHVIPCPTCAQRAKSSTYGRCGSVSSRFQRALSVESLQRVDESKPQEFSLTECAAAAVSHTEISCPYHVDEPVKLASLVPDLILSDLPKELLIDGKFLTFNPVEENRLGAGGAGEVFLGTYKKQRVAIKRFYSTKESWAEVDSEIWSGLSFQGNRGGSRHTDGSYFSGRVFITRLTSLEEELHRTKILSSFWEIRQEVSVLGRLNHPCVVALIGVCVRPLCIVLELSPMGSLFSILETELAKREEARFQKDSQMSVDVRKTIFERDLTYKIVYQVAHALYYLHNLGIIYRDLKSDNLLVWTLGKDALVHVKLSDYGISRFATPQGVLGEEGTPGFQAPEVRTGSTYNEKVDIFSFAMLIYEVLSGFRPYYECRCSAQIKKALRRGERPSLERNSIDSEMPEMEAMMEKCWRESIASRPSAESILERMEDPSFLCLHRVLPYADQDSWTSITAFIPLSTEDQVFTVGGTRPSKGNYSVLLWGGENEERCYSVIDCQTGFYQVPQTLCLGCRVACLVRVGDRYWLGTEGSAIEVFGRSAPGSDLKVLWSIKLRAQVLGLEVEQHVKYTSNDFPAPSIRRVFASLANGTVVVISRPEDRQNSSTICSLQFREGANDKLRQEASTFSVITTVEVGDRQCPACCMLFVNEGKELWVGCGNGVAVVDVETLEVCHNFRVYYSQRSNVRAMVTDGQTVFTINRQSTQVLQWHVETRRLLYRFDCNVDNPQDHVIAVKISSENEPADISSETTDPGDGDAFPSSKTSEEDEVENVLPSTQAPSGADSVSADPQILPEVPNISSQSSRFHRQPSLMRTLRKRGSRNSLRKKPRGGTESDVGSIPNTNAGGEIRSRTHVISNPRKRITSVLVVDGNLWLGRETGDVVVVDISCVGDEQEYGKVLGVLSTGNEPGHSKKEVHEMRKVGRDKVVCCGRIMRERKRCKERSNTAPTKYRSFISSTSPFKSLLPSRMHNQITNIVKNVEEEPSEKYQLSIWSRWNTEDFKQFYKYHEDLENAS